MFNVRYRYLYIVALAAYSYINIRITADGGLFDLPVGAVVLFVILLYVVFGVWELNRLVESHATKIASWLPRRIHPVLLIFLCSLVNTAVAAISGLLIFAAVLPGVQPLFNTGNAILLLAFGFRVNLFLNCINAIVFFMNKSKAAELQARSLEKVTIEAQFEALRNQINPHFLFNCLNALSSLVYKDADTSAKFIAQLSQVYRYLLYNQEKKIVTLGEELAFLDAYLFLLKIRFGDNVVFSAKLDDHLRHYYVAPAVLQMLIENAIKHNVVSREKPLYIVLESEGKNVVVRNNLQEKKVKENSSQIGLENIRRRYTYLSDDAVTVLRTDGQFTVKVPLLEMEPS